MKKLFRFFAVVAVFIGAAIWFVSARFEPETLRERLESGLAVATGRAWVVSGAVRLVPGLRPAVGFEGVRAPNAAWANTADFVRIENLTFHVDWWGLVRGVPQVSQVSLGDVVVNLETDGDGGNNWSTPPAVQAARQTQLRVLTALERIRIERSLVRFRSGWADAETTYPAAAIVLELHGESMPLEIAFDARVGGQPVSGSGQLGSPAAMLGGEAFDIALSGRYSGRESNANFVVAGRVGRLAGLEGLELRFTLNADSMNDVGAISGFELPRDTPVSITAVVVNTGEGPQLQDYVLRIGQAILRPQN